VSLKPIPHKTELFNCFIGTANQKLFVISRVADYTKKINLTIKLPLAVYRLSLYSTTNNLAIKY